MILAVLALGGALLGATTIAGFLMLYQIRATTDVENSAKAIFAADSGVEWELFNYYCADSGRCTIPPVPSPLLFSNGVVATSTCYDGSNAAVDCYVTSTAVYGVSEGTAVGSSRAFYVSLTGSSGIVP